jgi:REase_MTES_1575
MAAVLAAGPGAALSHRSAAASWDLRSSARGPVDVTAPRQRVRPGIQVRRAALAPDEITTRDGIPITTVARTLLDLAAVLPPSQLERAVERAEALGLADTVPLAALLERHGGRRGTAALREVLQGGVQPVLTREELEARFLTFLDAHDLPRPAVNEDLHLAGRWIQPDFLWREQRLIVELDGHETHRTRAAFERDRERDRILQAAGWRVVRITWRQLHEDPDAIAADLLRLFVAPR